MNKPHLYRIFLSVLFIIYSFTSFSQNKTTVQAVLDKNKILIGEHIQLTLQVNIPENEPIRFFEIDSIPHFEFIEKQKIDTANTSGGTVLKQVMRITSFDSGSFVIPSFLLAGGQIATDSLPVEVSYAPFDPQKDYNDIKDIIEVKPEDEKKEWQWKAVMASAIIVLITVLLIYFFRKRKKPAALVKAITNPYEAAMKQLAQLQKENLPAKIFYTRLVQIFREYIFNKKGVHSMQQTADDLAVQLKSLQLPNEKYTQLVQALRLSDYVKFAKYQPAESDNKNAFDTIKNSITEIEKYSPVAANGT